MPPTEDESPSRWQWLDWWFTPRWRALLTWVALISITETILFDYPNNVRFVHMAEQPIEYLNRFLPTRLPPVFTSIASSLTVRLVLIWFQPLALRLSLRRGLAWIVLSLVAEALWEFISDSPGYHSEWTYDAVRFGAAALQCWVLLGWRSRPWMCLPAWAATTALLRTETLDTPHFPWLASVVHHLPYAALLLYGTRLFTPEERERRER